MHFVAPFDTDNPRPYCIVTMRTNNARAQKYVDHFCFYLDKLLEAFESEPDNQKIHTKCASRALFLGIKLGLINNNVWPRIDIEFFGQDGWLNFSLSEKQDQAYLKSQLAVRAKRKSWTAMPM